MPFIIIFGTLSFRVVTLCVAYFCCSLGSDVFTARCYASAVIAMGLCLSVRLSVRSQCSIETAERIELVLACELPSTRPTVLKGNLVISKNKGTSSWNFVLNSGLRENFATAYRPSKRVINLARERWTLTA